MDLGGTRGRGKFLKHIVRNSQTINKYICDAVKNNLNGANFFKKILPNSAYINK